MSTPSPPWIWIFMGARAQFPSGVFTSLRQADEWACSRKLTGTLTKYPVDVGTYDWAVANGLFKPKTENHTSAAFIGRFSTASQEHYHYEDGQCDDTDLAEFRRVSARSDG